MTLLNILKFPDKRLKLVAKPVDNFDPDLPQFGGPQFDNKMYTLPAFVDSMFETMYEEVGVGLAAVQLNVQRRIITIDVSEDKSLPLCLINPVITNKRGSIEWEEGCLSFPGVFAKVTRAKEVDVTFFDRTGKEVSLSADGLLSVCIQHEIDHLDGITFYDHLSPLKQNIMLKKLEKIRRRAL